MANAKFTLKNYFKELKKAWLLLVIFAIIGAGAGAFYSFKKPVLYTANAKVLVNNSKIDNGAAMSPYAQITELLTSQNIVKNATGSDESLSGYQVAESPRGVFTITATASDADQAKKVANTVVESASSIMSIAFDDAEDYRVTIINYAEDAAPTVTAKTRVISIVIAAAAMLVLAAVVVFIKFDYRSEK